MCDYSKEWEMHLKRKRLDPDCYDYIDERRMNIRLNLKNAFPYVPNCQEFPQEDYYD